MLPNTLDYESQRLARIRENRARLEALGLPQLTSKARERGSGHKKAKMNRKVVAGGGRGNEDDDECMPPNEDEVDKDKDGESSFSGEEEEQGKRQRKGKAKAMMSTRPSLRLALRSEAPHPSSIGVASQSEALHSTSHNTGASGNQSSPLAASSESPEDEPPPRKGTRGNSRCLKVITLPRDEKLQTEWNDKGQMVGRNLCTFSSYSGALVREKVDVKIAKWTDVPADMKEHLWLAISDKFVIDHSHYQWVMQHCGKLYVDYKCKLRRKYYNSRSTDEERLKNKPSNVLYEDWAYLVHYWGSPKFQEVSQRNQGNREKQTVNHTVGSKAFAKIREEMKTGNADGSEPDPMEFFKATHISKKTGKPIDDASKAILDDFEQAKQSLEDGSSTSIAEIYAKVRGPERHGHVRGYGLGPTPSTVFGNKATRGVTMRIEGERVNEITELKKENEELREEVKELREELKDQRQAMNEIFSWINAHRSSHISQDSSSDEDLE